MDRHLGVVLLFCNGSLLKEILKQRHLQGKQGFPYLSKLCILTPNFLCSSPNLLTWPHIFEQDDPHLESY